MHLRHLILTGLGAASLALVGGLSAAAPVMATGGVIVVTTTADDYGADSSTCSLREAIRAISDTQPFGGCLAGAPGDTIQLQGGATYLLTRAGANEDNNAVGDLDILASLDIVGSGEAYVDGSGLNDRVLDVVNGTVTLSRIVVQNGVSILGGAGGGGIRNGGSLTLNTVKVLNNDASSTGFVGGGIFNLSTGSLTAVRTTVGNNHAQNDGGGIYNLGTVALTDSSIISNTAGNSGGGIANLGPVTLKNVTASGNQAQAGDGGGIYSAAVLTLNNVTVVANAALVGQGGGLRNFNSVVASNSLFALNTGFDPDCSGSLGSQGFNLIQDPAGCSISGASVISNTASPLLGPLANNGGGLLTHALLVGSPAIDNGNPAAPTGTGFTCEVYDQRGFQRKTPCDIGAYDADGVLFVHLPMIRN